MGSRLRCQGKIWRLCQVPLPDGLDSPSYRKVLIGKYRKIPKISPGAYIFQRSFSRGLFLEGLIFGGKFAFPNRLG